MPIAVVDRVVLSSTALAAMMTQSNAAAPVTIFRLGTVHLYKAGVSPTPATPVTALDEVVVADWAEYLPIATTGNGAQQVNPDGSVQIVYTPLLTWTGPAAGGGPTVNGAFMRGAGAGTPYLAAFPFKQPVGMADAGDVLTLLLPLILSGGPWSVQ